MPRLRYVAVASPAHCWRSANRNSDTPLQPRPHPLCYNTTLMLLRRFLLVMAALFFAALIFLSGYAAYPLLHQGAPPLTAADAAAAQAGDMGQFWQVWDRCSTAISTARSRTHSRAPTAPSPAWCRTFGDPYTFWVEPQTRELERDDLAGKLRRHRRHGGADRRRLRCCIRCPTSRRRSAGVLDGDRLTAVDGQPVTPR
jgi:hypothetical protein